MIRLSRMCERCLKLLGDNEEMYGFKVVDDESNERVFQGHKDCVEDMQVALIQIYGLKEIEKDDR